MQDTVEVKLPISEKIVVIRNYTTRNDDEKAEQTMYVGVNAEQEEFQKSKDNKTSVKFPLSNLMASTHIYIRRLVQSIDGDSSNIAIRLGELRSKDYEAIEKAVDQIVEDNSPKVKEAKEASKTATQEN